jgi:hypothetical protein
MRSTSTALGSLGLMLLLGGCNSFLGMHFSDNRMWKHIQVRPLGPQVATTDQKTQAGRAALDAGDLATAIASFRDAMNAGEPLPPALNGLGVAYARLDRLDLAQAYFQQAAAQAPDDPRYQDNLAMLMQAQSFVEAQRARAKAMADRMVATQKATAVQADGSRLQRISRTEVHIVTAPMQAAPRYRPTDVALNSDTSMIRIVAIVAGTTSPAGHDGTSAAQAPAPHPASNHSGGGQ